MNKMIHMILCPHCNKNHIDAEISLVCSDCEPKVAADMAVWDIFHAIERMNEKVPPFLLKNRLTVLKKAYIHLGSIIEMAEKC